MEACPNFNCFKPDSLPSSVGSVASTSSSSNSRYATNPDSQSTPSQSLSHSFLHGDEPSIQPEGDHSPRFAARYNRLNASKSL